MDSRRRRTSPERRGDKTAAAGCLRLRGDASGVVHDVSRGAGVGGSSSMTHIRPPQLTRAACRVRFQRRQTLVRPRAPRMRATQSDGPIGPPPAKSQPCARFACSPDNPPQNLTAACAAPSSTLATSPPPPLRAAPSLGSLPGAHPRLLQFSPYVAADRHLHRCRSFGRIIAA
jgi:hypothetical protein